jgi:hypothetical protein
MRTVVAVLLFFGVVSIGCSEEKKPEPQPPLPFEKWKFDHVTKTWGLKAKSVTYDPKQEMYFFLVEQTRDLTPEELKAVREVFPMSGRSGAPTTFAFYFLDNDNAVLEKKGNFDAMTEVTGTKGDSFRVQVSPPTNNKLTAADISSIELRPVK